MHNGEMLMAPIKEKDLEILSEIQENNRVILEKEAEINAMIEKELKDGRN